MSDPVLYSALMRQIYVAFKGLKHDAKIRELELLRAEKTQAHIYVYKYDKK